MVSVICTTKLTVLAEKNYRHNHNYLFYDKRGKGAIKREIVVGTTDAAMNCHLLSNLLPFFAELFVLKKSPTFVFDTLY